LSWEELAQKIGVRHLNGVVEPYFSRLHLQVAFAAVKAANARLEKAKTLPPAGNRSASD
jgi:hypothetical protein